MGIADRDYVRRRSDRFGEPTGLGRLGIWSITTWIIAINVVVFLINMFVHITWVDTQTGQSIQGPGILWYWGYFSLETLQQGQVWRVITFQFLHDQSSFMHILFNMVGLYFFGPMVESYLGRRRFTVFYLLCGIAGPLVYVLISMARILPMQAGTPMVGASAGLFGVLIAAAVITPHAMVQLIFPPIPMKLRTMALGLIAIAAFTIITRGNNAGGEAAHLGGAAAGYLLIRHQDWLAWAEKLPIPHKRRPRYMKYRP